MNLIELARFKNSNYLANVKELNKPRFDKEFVSELLRQKELDELEEDKLLENLREQKLNMDIDTLKNLIKYNLNFISYYFINPIVLVTNREKQYNNMRFCKFIREDYQNNNLLRKRYKENVKLKMNELIIVTDTEEERQIHLVTVTESGEPSESEEWHKLT